MGGEPINPLNAKLNPICHLLALLGAHPILHISGITVKWYCYHLCCCLLLLVTCILSQFIFCCKLHFF